MTGRENCGGDGEFVFLTLAGHLLGLLAAGGQFVAVTGIGALLLRRCGISGQARRRFLWSALTGTVLLGLLVLLLAALHLLHALTLVLLWVGLLPALPAGWRTLTAALLPRHWDGMVMPCAILGAVMLAASLAPPAQYDQLAYHLSVPLIYLQAGGLIPLTGNLPAQFPLLGSFTALPLIALAPAAATSAWFFFLAMLLPLALELLLVPLLRLNYRWLLRWLILSSPLFVYFATQIAYDLLLAALVFALFDLWRRVPDRRSVLPAGLLLGGALSLKYTSVMYAVPALALLLVLRPRAWRQLAAAMLLAAAVLSPWLLRNLRDTGNLLAPFEFSLPHSAAYARFMGDAQGGQPLTALPRWWLQVATLQYEPLIGLLPPLALLALLPAAWWCWRRRRKRLLAGNAAAVLLLALAVQGLWLVLAGQNVRLVFPALLLASAAVIALTLQRRRWPVLLRGCALLAGLLQLAQLLLIFPFMQALPMAGVGQLTDEEYLTAVCISPYFAGMRLSEEWPVPGTLLFAGECRSYYNMRPCIVAGAYDDDPLAVWTRQAANPEELHATLQRHGVVLVYYGLSEGARLRRGPLHDPALTAAERQRFVDMARRHLRIIGEGDGWLLAAML